MTQSERLKLMLAAEIDRQKPSLDAYKGLTYARLDVTINHGRPPTVRFNFGHQRNAIEWGNE